MAKQRPIFSNHRRQKGKWIVVFALIVFISLPWLRYMRSEPPVTKSLEPTKSDVKLESRTVSVPAEAPVGYLFSVAIDDRYHHLAKKISQGTYCLAFLSSDVSIEKGQQVYTTGLDHLFDADILVGQVVSVEQSDDSIYQSVMIKSD